MGEYLSSNALIAYPFLEDAPGLRGVGLRIPLDLIVDAAFEANTMYGWWYLDRIQRISASQLDLIVAQDGVFPCRCSATLAVDPVLGTLSPYILAFDPEPLPPLPPRTARLILSREALTSYLGTLADSQIVQFGTSLPFEKTATDPSGRGVSSLMLWNDGPPGPFTTPISTGLGNGNYPDGAIRGDVTINCGYNISLDQVDPAAGDQTPLTLQAVPGAGVGKAPCVDEPTFTKGIPGVIPLQGTVTIKGGQDGCYAVVPIPSLGTIQLQGHCQACCTCDDYIVYLDYLHGLCDRVRALHIKLDTLWTDCYEPAVQRYNTVLAPPYLAPTLAIYGFRGSDYGLKGSPSGRVGSPNWFRAVITIVNNSINPISISALGATATPGTAVSASYTIDGPGAPVGGALAIGSLAAGLPAIPAGRRVVVTVLYNAELQTWLGSGQWVLTVYGAAIDNVTAQVTPLAKTFTTT